MNEETKPKFEEWCLVEIMGHQRIVGKVTEAVLAGGAFLRVDVPPFNGSPAFTRFYSPGSLYCISPISEAVARQLMAANRNEPVSRFELPQIAEKVEERPAQSKYEEDYCMVCGEREENCACDPEDET
jgi:hypothetical protein